MNRNEILKKYSGKMCLLKNLVGGKWKTTEKYSEVISPLSGEPMLARPDTSESEIEPFLAGLKSCPKSGLHNPFKNVERYRMLGEVSFRAAKALDDPDIANRFAHLIQFVMPKSDAQCMGEVTVTKEFLKNFSGDQVRFLARSTGTPGDHAGHEPRNYPLPFGPVVIISPFNFPLEIPALHMMGALYMGNRPLVKPDKRTGLVIEQFIRLLHACGLPKTDVDLIHCDGQVMDELLKRGRKQDKKGIRLVQFTGSNKVADRVSMLTRGKVRLEDAGFDWKILGPDYHPEDKDYVAWQCDQDAYAASGQKCSAESVVIKHKNWGDAIWLEMRKRAATRKLDDLTIGPVITWNTNRLLSHIKKLSAIPGANVAWGGRPLTGHAIPECYGAIEPTAVFVPIDQIASPKYFDLVTTEVFGPVQVLTEYTDNQINLLLDICERMPNHLTAGIVSRDQEFIDRILGATVNGTTYAGIRARTTGAPQNHWFGPSGDPRAAGIGTPEAIVLTWSAPRCIIRDTGPIDRSAKLSQS